MSEPGELTVIARIAKPDVAVITNIGITHIEQLGSRENIYREKLTIQDGLSDGGILILNGDDDMLCRTRGKAGVKTVYYGTGETCDYRAWASSSWTEDGVYGCSCGKNPESHLEHHGHTQCNERSGSHCGLL